MSTLTISYPQIPWRSLTATPSNPLLEDRGIWNAIGGPRYLFCETASSTTTQSLVFDLGASTTLSADHFAIAHGSELSGVTVYLENSSDNLTYNTVATVAVASINMGPRAQDYFGTFTASAARRYWRVRMTHGSGSKFPISKLSFGSLWDFGTEPAETQVQIVTQQPTFRATSQALHLAKLGEEIRQVRMVWEGVSDDVARQWHDNIARYRWEMPLFLNDSAGTTRLGNTNLLHVRLVESRVEAASGVVDRNRITTTFEEQIG